jgi:hypothetical protein
MRPIVKEVVFMPQESNHNAPEQQKLCADTEIAKALGVSRAWLQKDRVTAQRIPFIRLGDRCLYRLDEVLAALKSYQVGGPSRGRNVRGHIGR